MLYKKCKHGPGCRCPWWYEFTVRGKRYRKSTRTANRQTAQRIEQRRRDRVLDPYAPDDEDDVAVSLTEHVRAYCEHTAKTNRTAYKDAAVLARLVKLCPADLASVSPFHIERWKIARAGEVTKATVNRELNIVRGCFTRAVEWKRIKESPCGTVKPFDVDDQRVRVLTDDELRKVLTMEPYTRLLCQVTLECLPRLSEVLNIHKSHIGPTWIEIRRKGGAVERIGITEELRAELLAQVHPVSGFVFGVGEKGKVPSEQRASLRVVRELRRVGVKDASHHTMRHTGVTLMLEHGRNPRAIQKLAGWSSMRMLMRYGHTRDAELQGAVRGNAAYLDALKTADKKEAV